MSTTEIIKAVADAFDTNDNETILSYMADDMQWLMPGNSTIAGKEGMRKFFSDHPNTKVLSVTKDNFIIDSDKGIINGEVSCLTDSGNVCHMFYCDIYELENGKVKKLTSYMIDKETGRQ